MNKLFFFFLLLSTSVFSQTEQDTLKMTALDSAIVFSTELNEITINKDKTYTIGDDKKALLILKRRVFRVYPYAKITADKLTQLNATMEKLKTAKEKKKYFKNQNSKKLFIYSKFQCVLSWCQGYRGVNKLYFR